MFFEPTLQTIPPVELEQVIILNEEALRLQQTSSLGVARDTSSKFKDQLTHYNWYHQLMILWYLVSVIFVIDIIQYVLQVVDIILLPVLRRVTINALLLCPP